MNVNAWRIVYVYLKELPHVKFPLAFLDGRASFVVNHWVFDMIRRGVGLSLLNERLRAVLHLYSFYVAKHRAVDLDETQSSQLVLDFLNAKKCGTGTSEFPEVVALGWKPLKYRSFKRYVTALEAWDKWQSAFHKGPRLTSTEQRLMTAWEQYSDFLRRKNWDPLLHLFPAKTKTKKSSNLELIVYHRRLSVKGKEIPKCFPPDLFVELVEGSKSSRDKLLWLELFGLGLRESEPLHHFLQDVHGVTPAGEALVRLDDPEVGQWEWANGAGRLIRGTRTEYLRTQWENSDLETSYPDLVNLAPRTQYVCHGQMRAGFKGMTFHTDDSISPSNWGHEGIWIAPPVGRYFLATFKEYVEEHFHGRPRRWPYHPWLYIKLDRKDYGLPMTIPALRKAWNRALRRLGLAGSDLGPHSLRHLAGYFCANQLGLSIEKTMLLLRHAKSESTEKYYHLSKNEVRTAIAKAATTQSGHHITDFLLMPEAKRIKFPAHWDGRVESR
ncbi:site-specific integrase [Paucibacter sp. AS339]|uniref:site-specific integrase n=1 Tax=Paucibacter hankyongi TaxID=3133434 RepID=UPI003098BF01